VECPQGLPAGFQEEMLKERLAKKKEGSKGEPNLGDMEEKIAALSAKVGGLPAGLREAGKSSGAKVGGASSGGASGSSGLDLGGLDHLDAKMGSLNASNKEMEELLASMGDD